MVDGDSPNAGPESYREAPELGKTMLWGDAADGRDRRIAQPNNAGPDQVRGVASDVSPVTCLS